MGSKQIVSLILVGLTTLPAYGVAEQKRTFSETCAAWFGKLDQSDPTLCWRAKLHTGNYVEKRGDQTQDGSSILESHATQDGDSGKFTQDLTYTVKGGDGESTTASGNFQSRVMTYTWVKNWKPGIPETCTIGYAYGKEVAHEPPGCTIPQNHGAIGPQSHGLQNKADMHTIDKDQKGKTISDRKFDNNTVGATLRIDAGYGQCVGVVADVHIWNFDSHGQPIDGVNRDCSKIVTDPTIVNGFDMIQVPAPTFYSGDNYLSTWDHKVFKAPFELDKKRNLTCAGLAAEMAKYVEAHPCAK